MVIVGNLNKNLSKSKKNFNFDYRKYATDDAVSFSLVFVLFYIFNYNNIADTMVPIILCTLYYFIL